MKWFSNLNTMTKLMSAFAIVCALMTVVGLVGLNDLQRSNAAIDTLYSRHMMGITAIMEADVQRYLVGRAVRQSILEATPEGARTQLEAIDAAVATMRTSLDEADKTLATAEAKANMKSIREAFDIWGAGNHHIAELAVQGRGTEALDLLGENGKLGKVISEGIDQIRDSKLKLGQEAMAAADKDLTAARALLVALLVAGVLFAFGTGYVISKSIAGPLGRAEQVLGSVADGDFTVRLDVDTKDEIGRVAASLNRAVSAMRDALTQVSVSASNVATASNELSSASQSISGGAQEQASSLEETAASLEQMTSAVKQNADNAQQAAQLAQGAREVAEKGGKVVGSAVEAMTEINASSRKIADIITAIDEIAFQTNLLALNAAVEAARAGEQGRGFAVVAGEVRNLAQRSASAAKEIKGLIQDSVEKVEAGSKLVNQSGTTLDEIVTSVKRVTDIVGEIAASSREQSTGIEQVNTAVTQMDAVTQSNASQTEELAGTADGLSGQARQMMALVQKFKLGEGNSPTPVGPAVQRTAKMKLVALPRRGGKPTAIHHVPAPVAAATGTDGGFEEF